jgi:hypothetical protein
MYKIYFIVKAFLEMSIVEITKSIYLQIKLRIFSGMIVSKIAETIIIVSSI